MEDVHMGRKEKSSGAKLMNKQTRKGNDSD